MSPRNPGTPDCAIDGCTRAERRLGLCTVHAQLVPAALSIELATACVRASHDLRVEYEARALSIAQERLAQEAPAA